MPAEDERAKVDGGVRNESPGNRISDGSFAAGPVTELVDADYRVWKNVPYRKRFVVQCSVAIIALPIGLLLLILFHSYGIRRRRVVRTNRWLKASVIAVCVLILVGFFLADPDRAQKQEAYAQCVQEIQRTATKAVRFQFPSYGDLLTGPTIDKNTNGYTIAVNADVFQDSFSTQTPIDRYPFLCGATPSAAGWVINIVAR